MSKTITWIRPSGSEITTNGLPATIARAAELGWKPKDGEESAPKADAKKATKADAKKAD